MYWTVLWNIFDRASIFCSPTIWRVSDALSSKSSTFTHISYTPESSLSDVRMNRILSLSVLRMFTLFVSRGWPFFVQLTTGLGLPFVFKKKDKDKRCQTVNFEELCSFIKIRSSSTYCEGDGQVDLISNVGHISLPEETGQADLGTIYRERKINQNNQWLLQ